MSDPHPDGWSARARVHEDDVSLFVRTTSTSNTFRCLFFKKQRFELITNESIQNRKFLHVARWALHSARVCACSATPVIKKKKKKVGVKVWRPRAAPTLALQQNWVENCHMLKSHFCPKTPNGPRATLKVPFARRSPLRDEPQPHALHSCRSSLQSVLVGLVTPKRRPSRLTSLPATVRECARAASSYQELCKRGKIWNRKCNWPSQKHVNFKMHGPCASCRGARGAPCSTDCMAVVVHGSVWFSYLLSAETFPLCFDGGEGKHKSLLSRSLPPSPSRGASAARPFCNKDAKTSLDLHALGALFRSKRARRHPRPRYQCTASAASGKARFLQIHCKKILRSTYMMGQELAAESS